MPSIPRVAVLIPARNEAASIGRCLEHVLDQDIPRDELEVVVVDGDSDDDTAQIAAAILGDSRVARWTVHDNPGGATPSNLNAGLALVRAPVVCRVDARSLIPSHYVRTCRDILEARSEIAVVGGSQVAVARSDSTQDLGIARALNNKYGMGLSRYRRGAHSGPSDTVYLGAFRTAQLRGAGGWDERLGTNQDFDLNRRMSVHGIVWFDDSLEVGYLPRGSIGDLWRQYHRFGRWKVRYWAVTADRPQPRQMVIAVVPVVGLGLSALAVVARRRRARSVVLVAATGVALVAAVDAAGSPESDSAPVRLWSWAALSTVWSGWLLGLWGAMVPFMMRRATTGDRTGAAVSAAHAEER